MTGTALLIGTPDGERRIGPEEQVLRIGRDPLCRIVIEDPRVSREHVEVRFLDGGWRLRDLGSSNGTYAAGARVDELDLARPHQIRLGAADGPAVTLRPETAVPSFEAGRVPSATYRAAHRTRIGRGPDNDIVLADLQVSRHHADLLRTGTGLRLVDLGTRNGTFVNGRRIDEADLRTGDLLSFGRHQLVVDGTQLREYVDTGRVSLRVDGLGVTVAGGRRLLDRVGFELGECSLLAVVGPSGAGKSTLLGALTGYRPANEGAVVYQGRDLYAEYDDLRQRIGLVPQDDILHTALTVRRALRYAAALRFGADVSTAEREQRIDEVIGQLGLTAQADQRIDTLSGGQRKRTSVALELLTEPSLLFLDEPTSGLDPSLDRDVMVSLRDLADRGRTVVVVTHSPLHLNVCDRVLVLGRGGKVAYFGPPGDLLPFFGASEYADVFKQVYDDPDGWAARHTDTMTLRPAAGSAPANPPAEAPPPRQGWWRQLAILARRMTAVTLADRMYAALLLGLPLGLAALLYVIPGDDGFARPHNPLGRSAEAAQLAVVLIIGAVFFGLAGGVRELVRERAIYRRERAVGLAPGAYLGSKVLVFAAVNGVQAALFVLVGLAGRPGARDALALPWPLAELIVVVWLTALVSTVTGLLVSAYVSTGEQTMPVLVGLVMAQLVLCGGLFAVVGRAGVEQLSWLAPARWGYAAAAATVDLRSLELNPSGDALWRHTAAAWWWAMGVLALQGAAVTAAGRWALRRHEPGR